MELYANLTACIMRLHQLLHSAAPREITAIIELGFASCDYCINLHSAAPRAINSVIALYAVRLAYIIRIKFTQQYKYNKNNNNLKKFQTAMHCSGHSIQSETG